MEHYAGIDVSLELSSVCIVDTQGKIVKEAKVASDPEDLIAFFASLGFAVKRIGLEAGPLSQWLQSGLKCAGLEVVLLETRHVKAALSVSVPDAAPIDQTPTSVQWENDQSPLQEAAEGTPRLKSPTSATKSAETRHGDYLLCE